jgi:hypothetical protein
MMPPERKARTIHPDCYLDRHFMERGDASLYSRKTALNPASCLRTSFAQDPNADAALAGARLRLRPILMTAFAFVLGCVPLWRAAGSGAASRQILGTTVIGGMLAATFLAIFLIPVSFYLVEKLSHQKGKASPETTPWSSRLI